MAAVLELMRAGDAPWHLPVDGSSMHPLLARGDRVVVDPARPISVGAIVAFGRAQQLVVHRVVRVDDDSIVEMGDNSHGQATVRRADVLGAAIGVELLDGRVIDLTSRLAMAHGRFAARWSRCLPAGRRVAARYAGYIPRALAMGLRVMARRRRVSPPTPTGGESHPLRRA